MKTPPLFNKKKQARASARQAKLKFKKFPFHNRHYYIIQVAKYTSTQMIIALIFHLNPNDLIDPLPLRIEGLRLFKRP